MLGPGVGIEEFVFLPFIISIGPPSELAGDVFSGTELDLRSSIPGFLRIELVVPCSKVEGNAIADSSPLSCEMQAL